jgi:4-carboxymuconolactone decarboxylase
MDERERYRRGLSVRRRVLGHEHVDRAARELTDFNRDFQDLMTRYAWGEVWSRPGLPPATRSLVTLAMMMALNRPEELRLHLRAAANTGLTREQIAEVLLQGALYCGLPAANAAFHAAAEVFAEAAARPRRARRKGHPPGRRKTTR